MYISICRAGKQRSRSTSLVYSSRFLLSTCNEVDFYGSTSTCNEVELRVIFVNITNYRHLAFYFFQLHNYSAVYRNGIHTARTSVICLLSR